MWLGRITAYANRFPIDDGVGGGKKRFIRDSAGLKVKVVKARRKASTNNAPALNSVCGVDDQATARLLDLPRVAAVRT